ATNVQSPVTFLWSSVAGAQSYRVYASLDGGAIVLIGETDQTSITRPLPPGKVKWLVETIFKECPSTRTPSADFTVAASTHCTGDASQPSSPAAGATISIHDVDLSWTPVSGADTTTATTSHPIQLPTGDFHWFVEASFANCPPTRSAIGDFGIVKPPSCGTPDKPTVTLAAAVVSDALYTLRWSPVANADKY